MRGLPKLLSQWQEADLISIEQVEEIKTFEATRPSNGWMLRGFMGLAVTAIGIGVISLIAMNWEDVPDLVKLVSNFLVLLGLGASVLVMERQKNETGVEVLLLAFLFGCLATIGLISQVFHTGGRLEMALMFWSAITAPAAVMSRQRMVSSVWLWTLMGAVTFWGVEKVTQFSGWREEKVIMLLLPCFPFACYLGRVALARLTGKSNFVWSLSAVLVVTWFGAIALYDFALTFGEIWPYPGTVPYLTGAGVLAALALALAARTEGLWGFRLWLYVGASIVYLFMAGIVISIEVGPVLSMALTITLFSVIAVDMGIQGRRYIFQILLAMVAIRFLFFYFLTLGGLALTAFGLIGSGAIILLAVWVWHRNRLRLQTWLEGMAP